MRQIISYYIIQQLLFFTSSTESLRGAKVVDADDDEFPFIASLQHSSRKHFCSGTVISKKHVLTASHCLADEQPEDVRVVMGVEDLQSATLSYTVAFWLTYNVWASRLNLMGATGFNDIAVITLSDNISIPNVNAARLIDLHSDRLHVQGKSATIVGWSCGSRIKVLQKATVNILRDDNCRRNIYLITDTHRGRNLRLLCTAAEPYALLQYGDSGGPLLDASGALLGINVSVGPRPNTAWGNFSDEFLRGYQINLHTTITHAHYRQFIVSVTG